MPESDDAPTPPIPPPPRSLPMANLAMQLLDAADRELTGCLLDVDKAAARAKQVEESTKEIRQIRKRIAHALDVLRGFAPPQRRVRTSTSRRRRPKRR